MERFDKQGMRHRCICIIPKVSNKAPCILMCLHYELCMHAIDGSVILMLEKVSSLGSHDAKLDSSRVSKITLHSKLEV